MKWLAVCWASAVGASFAYSVARGGVLIPDSYSYAQGRSWWSSPVAAIVGGFGGMTLLSIFSAIAALAYVGLGLYWLRNSPVLAFGWCSLVLVGPWGAALGCAGADAAGAVALALLRRRGYRAVPAVCGLHLAAGLALAAQRTTRNMIAPGYALLLACGGEVVVLRALGLVTHSHEPTQMQWRYLLPALLVWTQKNRRADALTSTLPETHGGTREYATV